MGHEEGGTGSEHVAGRLIPERNPNPNLAVSSWSINHNVLNLAPLILAPLTLTPLILTPLTLTLSASPIYSKSEVVKPCKPVVQVERIMRSDLGRIGVGVGLVALGLGLSPVRH